MEDRERSTVTVAVYGLWGLLVLGALAVLIDVALARPRVLGIRFARVGQLLLFLAFAVGAAGFAQVGYPRYTLGFAFLAAGWGLLFVDWFLGEQLGEWFVPGLLVLFVVGMSILLVGMVSDEEAQEVLLSVPDPLEDVV
ncbi:hypothetical protein [Halorientalis salina]|uniref:hypothetical protein n=1 Tax=Halorientalis salina TaxID=2932266 RepID=UPI0010ACAA54|nr:hypothetical protein [Halorientalis salina]